MSGSWIRILDGSNCDAREMLHLTSDSGEMPKQEYVSTSNAIMLIFASSLAEPDDLFEASYMSDGYKSTEYLPTSDTITSQPSQPSTQKDSSVLLKPAIIVGISLLVNVIRALPTGT
ncbi:unnamed protein product [Dicrocoelium dendriticum]|nr:unnamed protein product [Dicrocoelium dendriticum]